VPVFRPAKPPLRYFLYVSDAKLDMLFEQLDPALRRRISAEVKVDLKLASVTLRQAEHPAARIAKLRLVERYIDAHHQVGTLAAPGQEFFRGRLRMQWGWLARGKHPDDSLPVVFFRGRQDEHFVALAGSRSHVVGQHVPENAVFGYSSAPSIVAAIRAHVSDLEGVPRYPAWGEDWDNPRNILASQPVPVTFHISEASYVDLDTPPQPMEFLAIPLGHGPVKLSDGSNAHGVLGTPIYVAHAGPRSGNKA
jgi:hypothetical protein